MTELSELVDARRFCSVTPNSQEFKIDFDPRKINLCLVPKDLLFF